MSAKASTVAFQTRGSRPLKSELMSLGRWSGGRKHLFIFIYTHTRKQTCLLSINVFHSLTHSFAH